MGRMPEDMLTLLQGAGFSTGKLYHSHMPSTPHEVICVLPTTSLDPEEVHSGDPIRRPGAQVVCRSTRWETAWDNAHIAWTALRSYNVTIGGSKYLAIRPMQDPLDLGKDENERRLVGFNIQISRG